MECKSYAQRKRQDIIRYDIEKRTEVLTALEGYLRLPLDV